MAIRPFLLHNPFIFGGTIAIVPYINMWFMKKRGRPQAAPTTEKLKIAAEGTHTQASRPT